MNITNMLVAICSVLFLMIGADKFFIFMEPPCSLMNSVPQTIWKLLGVLQLVSALLIWSPKFRKYIVGFFFVFMIVFVIVHLVEGTYDIGGAVFMATILGLLVWNPDFIKGRQKQKE